MQLMVAVPILCSSPFIGPHLLLSRRTWAEGASHVEDAFRCFMGCEMETLVVGNCVLDKLRLQALEIRRFRFHTSGNRPTLKFC